MIPEIKSANNMLIGFNDHYFISNKNLKHFIFSS